MDSLVELVWFETTENFWLTIVVTVVFLLLDVVAFEVEVDGLDEVKCGVDNVELNVIEVKPDVVFNVVNSVELVAAFDELVNPVGNAV